MVLQPDGKIVIDGSAGEIGTRDVTVIRYNSDGSLDTSFSEDGIVTTDINGHSDMSRGVKVKPNGKIVVAASTYNVNEWDFAVVRYNSDGSLDPSFSGDGIVTTDATGPNEGSEYLALQSDGKIVVVGYTWDGAQHDVVVLRYEGYVDPCECDLSHDGKCDMQDWLLFGVDWGRTDCGTPTGSGNEPNDCECDLNADGKCDMQDWLKFGEDWGRTDCP